MSGPLLLRARTRARPLAVACALVLALVALVAPARGGEPDPEHCSARIHAWVADAGRSASVLARAVACGPDRVKIRLEPRDAAALELEVTRAPDRAFRRAGAFGVSPLLQVDDWKQVPAARREPFERLVVWIEAHPDQVAFGGGALPEAIRAPIERAHVPSGSPWIFAAAIALLVAARRRSPRPARSDRLAALGLVALALPLRLALGAWGPLRINGLAPLWIMAAAVDPSEAVHYGPGYAELFGLPARHLPLAPDHAIFLTNAVVSALVPLLLFALLRLVEIDRRRAALAALALVLDPVSIRIATTESYIPAIEALAAASAIAAALGAIHAGRREPRRAFAMALAAGLLGAQAARIHPAAWIPVALAPLAAAGPPQRSRWARLALGVGAVAVAGATVVLTSATELLHALESSLTGDTMRPNVMRPEIGPALAVCLIAALLVARPRWALAWGALAALALAATRLNYAQSPLWLASFERLYAVPLLAGAAALVPPPLARSRALVAAAALALVALFVRRAPTVLEGRTTDHVEYRWARSWLERKLPPSCRVAYVALAGRRNLFLPTYVASPPLSSEAILRLDGREPIDAHLVLGEPRCTYYVRTSLCSTPEGRAVCDAVERQLVLEPVERASFPAVPSNMSLVYDRDPVESVIERVVGFRDAP